jgi:hypothetical protein
MRHRLRLHRLSSRFIMLAARPNADGDPARVREVLLGSLFLFVVAPIALLVMPIWLPAGLAAHRWREHRFRQHMRAAGRFLNWPELLPRLERAEGTLIVEQAQKDSCRVWWTPENVLHIAGDLQPPGEAELDYLRCREAHPFVRWCYERFTAPSTGAAALANPPYRYPPGFVTASFFREKFPSLAVVMTVKQA